MSFITSIGASIFSDLSIYNGTTTDFSSTDTQAEFEALFTTEDATPGATTFQRLKNIREYPPMGVPPNVVNVPVYGQKSSQQIQAQSDAPSMEIQLNYVASEWAPVAGKIGAMVDDGLQHVFRFTLLNSEPTGTGNSKYASTVGGIGTRENACFYWIGKLDALMVNPSLSDATTATLTITVQSKFYGAFTI